MAWLAAKECKACGAWKGAAGFYRHETNRDRREGTCIACKKFEAAELRRLKLDERRAYDRLRYKSNCRRRRVTIESARRAKQRAAFERALEAIAAVDACCEPSDQVARPAQ